MAGHGKQQIPNDLRQKVYTRDGHRCRYCGSFDGPLHIDHVYPESRGGPMVVENLVTACQKCNRKKSCKVGIWPKPIGYFDEENFETFKKQKDKANEKYRSVVDANKKIKNAVDLFHGLAAICLSLAVGSYTYLLNSGYMINKTIVRIAIIVSVVLYLMALSAHLIAEKLTD